MTQLPPPGDHRAGSWGHGPEGHHVVCICRWRTGDHPTETEAADEWRAHAGLPTVAEDRAAEHMEPIDWAQASVDHAIEQLRVWHSGESNPETSVSYVAAGRQAIREIDDALHYLHKARTQLQNEIRVDDEERAIRVDLMLAQFRAEREQGDERGVKPTTTRPHEGFHLGGRGQR